jgi:Protein of unknown function DUF262
MDSRSTGADARPTRELRSISAKAFIEDYVYRIDLDADYQREKIWSRRNQEDLLDSIVKNIDIPKLYLAQVTDNDNFDFECIDGKQRITTLLRFFKPEPNEESPLRVPLAGAKYTYEQLSHEHPTFARRMEEFELTFVVYPEIDDEDFLREIFRRLQLGVPLNSGERLNSLTGTIRDFIYADMGKGAPFLRLTRLSEKRFSRQFALAQICINSFSRAQNGEFVRARFNDLEDFFKEKYDLDINDENLLRIRAVLQRMDEHLGKYASSISSRAVAVSAYLFVEDLCARGNEDQVPDFGAFYAKLLAQIKAELKLLSNFREPTNGMILEGFQRHITQASVEPFAIKSRNTFLERAFRYYLDPRTKGGIIGSN